jgi:hypothetical protein
MNIYSVAYSSIELTSQEKGCMIRACLNHAKGGHSDFYERQAINCEGGSSTTSDVRGSRKAALAHEGDARLSRIECVADTTGVRGRILREASEHQSTEHTNRITEANLFGLPVAHVSLSRLQPVQRYAVMHYLVVIIRRWATICNISQHFAQVTTG